ncbi:MAG: aminopeptidase P family protein [Bacteroidales bacterium]
MNKNRRLSSIRAAMKECGVSAYYIPMGDPHMGEYIPDHWQIIKWLTGFSGSAATVIITKTFAGLWTDSRYFIQASVQIQDSGFELMKLNSADGLTPVEWLSRNIARKTVIGFDGRLISLKTLRQFKEKLYGKNVTINTDCDLVDGCWEGRPALPDYPAYNYPMEYAGKGRDEKIRETRQLMKEIGADYHLITSSEDVMWLLNIRGGDTRFLPVLLSMAIITPGQVLLFTDERKVPPRLASDFDKEGIVLLPYTEINPVLSTLPEESSLLYNPSNTSVMLADSVKAGTRIIEDISITARLKAIRNNTEIACLREIMVRDGVALAKFFFWLEKNHESGDLNEPVVADKLLECRVKQVNFMSESFPAIVAFGKNAAMPHYSVNRSVPVQITRGILLVDSGGQYLGGTTDITRVVSLGTPTLKQKADFTLALKGTIALALAIFPEGTKGYQLDILARKALWDNYLNFGHGTGHGVGSFLNVHEGPQSITPVCSHDKYLNLLPGMVVSDEPGIYREGEYGFRTENLMLVVPDRRSEYGLFNRFETLSLCYIDSALVDTGLLNAGELDWLNNYHSHVFEKISPYLDQEEKKWLKKKTEELKF